MYRLHELPNPHPGIFSRHKICSCRIKASELFLATDADHFCRMRHLNHTAELIVSNLNYVSCLLQNFLSVWSVRNQRARLSWTVYFLLWEKHLFVMTTWNIPKMFNYEDSNYKALYVCKMWLFCWTMLHTQIDKIHRLCNSSIDNMKTRHVCASDCICVYHWHGS